MIYVYRDMLSIQLWWGSSPIKKYYRVFS